METLNIPLDAQPNAQPRKPLASELMEHYQRLEGAQGYFSLCKMYVPENGAGLAGKRVLDVNCRNGKGVYKFSQMVGADGFALGCDYSAASLERARAGIASGLAKSGLAQSNMDFVLAYPETLSCAVEKESFDAVYLNDSINLAYSLPCVLQEANAVLKPGGTLICRTVLADCARDEDTLKAAREMGNSVQSAPACDEFLALLVECGFDDIAIERAEDVLPDTSGSDNPQDKVPFAPSVEAAHFFVANISAKRVTGDIDNVNCRIYQESGPVMR